MNKYSAKDARQSAILEAIASTEIATQNELVAALRKKGVQATQVSISRDIAELGLVKSGGVYRPASAEARSADPQLPLRAFVRAVIPAGPNLTVVRCDVGTAPRVGLALDGLALPGLVGTLAGDDTVFAASDTAASQKKLVEFLNSRLTHS